MSGIDLAEQLRLVRPDTAIVLVSGNMRSNEVERAHRCGIKEVIMKPFGFDELGAVLRRLLTLSPS